MQSTIKVHGGMKVVVTQILMACIIMALIVIGIIAVLHGITGREILTLLKTVR